MGDITSEKLLWLKAALFLSIGVIAGSLILAETRSPRIAFLLLLTIWGFCRAYYFAFYVIERYADPGYRFSGLGSFLRYALRRFRSAAPRGVAAIDSKDRAAIAAADPREPPVGR